MARAERGHEGWAVGWLRGRGGRDEDEPTLDEAWRTLAARTGLAVHRADEWEVRADGAIRGRPVSVHIAGRRRGSEFLAAFTGTNRRRVHEVWSTELTVGCRNPRGITGTLVSFVDTDDPAWEPGRFDMSLGRVVRADPPELGDLLLDDAVRERLMGLVGDHTITIHADAVRLSAERKASKDGGWFVGVPIHVEYPGAPLPWPERALAGPPWWIDLLCDLADGLDAAPA